MLPTVYPMKRWYGYLFLGGYFRKWLRMKHYLQITSENGCERMRSLLCRERPGRICAPFEKPGSAKAEPGFGEDMSCGN